MSYLSTILRCAVVPALLSATLLPAALLSAADWPNWRGPTLDGASGETTLPEKLDDSTKLWVTKMPGPSAGTPIVWGDKIFLPSIDTATANLTALCVERTSGKILWNHAVSPSLGNNSRNDLAAPSAATNGKQVVFMYGSGDLAAFTLDGKSLWARNLQKEYGKFQIMWLYGSSPLMAGDRLFVQVLQNDSKKTPEQPSASFVKCIDPATGKDIWHQWRPSDAVYEALESYGTPIIYTANGREELALFGGDMVTAYDPATGKELWRSDGYNERKQKNWRSIPGSALIDGKVVSITARGGRTFAVKPGGSGDVTGSHVAWNTTDVTSDVCMPLFYQGKMYVLDGDKKIFRCVDPATGKVLWQGDIPAKPVLRASPTGGGGRIYIMDESATVYVLAADKFQILGTYPLGEGGIARATVVASHGTVFVRTAEKLFAFGAK